MQQKQSDVMNDMYMIPKKAQETIYWHSAIFSKRYKCVQSLCQHQKTASMNFLQIMKVHEQRSKIDEFVIC